MNERFFTLPIEKQQAIINAGYRVFSQNTYKKSPVSEIADAAGISKSLLFYYFKNKKELYIFLWDECARITSETLVKYGCYEQKDLFEAMRMGLKAKASIMKRYPDMGAFALKAYYEKDPDICNDIQKDIQKKSAYKQNAKVVELNPDVFIPGLDLEMMYKDMYLASEGYLWEKMQQGNINVDEMEQDFNKMIEFWKKIYLRKEG